MTSGGYSLEQWLNMQKGYQMGNLIVAVEKINAITERVLRRDYVPAEIAKELNLSANEMMVNEFSAAVLALQTFDKRIGKWLSAALSEPDSVVCREYKDDIEAMFDALKAYQDLKLMRMEQSGGASS